MGHKSIMKTGYFYPICYDSRLHKTIALPELIFAVPHQLWTQLYFFPHLSNTLFSFRRLFWLEDVLFLSLEKYTCLFSSPPHSSSSSFRWMVKNICSLNQVYLVNIHVRNLQGRTNVVVRMPPLLPGDHGLKSWKNPIYNKRRQGYLNPNDWSFMHCAHLFFNSC